MHIQVFSYDSRYDFQNVVTRKINEFCSNHNILDVQVNHQSQKNGDWNHSSEFMVSVIWTIKYDDRENK